VGEKSPGERFPGADHTYCIEAMMQDRKALQAGTSHYLGQNFSRAASIEFQNEEGERVLAYTTSWGVTTRLIGAMIMCHADDDGMCLPPRVAPKHAVILPVVPKPEHEAEVFAAADALAERLRAVDYHGRSLEVQVDKRDLRGGEKNWQWIKKGIPLRIEIGPRDIESGSCMVAQRSKGHKDRQSYALDGFADEVVEILDGMQQSYFDRAQAYRAEHLNTGIQDFEEMKAFFTPQNPQKPEIHGGFVLGKWCGDPETEELLADLKVSIRCLPLEQSGTVGKCLITGREATLDAIFAKSY
jgi:prolyl-tRNA synthetase